jgi:hypothetical protein
VNRTHHESDCSHGLPEKLLTSHALQPIEVAGAVA